MELTRMVAVVLAGKSPLRPALGGRGGAGGAWALACHRTCM